MTIPIDFHKLYTYIVIYRVTTKMLYKVNIHFVIDKLKWNYKKYTSNPKNTGKRKQANKKNKENKEKKNVNLKP